MLLFAWFIADAAAPILRYELLYALQTDDVPAFAQTAALCGIAEHLGTRRTFKQSTLCPLGAPLVAHPRFSLFLLFLGFLLFLFAVLPLLLSVPDLLRNGAVVVLCHGEVAWNELLPLQRLIASGTVRAR